MRLEVFSSHDTGLPRTGHAIAYCAALRSLVLFGGLPSNGITMEARDEAAAVPLFGLPFEALRAAACELPGDAARVAWTALPQASPRPRSRHGHFIHCYDRTVFVVGGNFWSLNDEFPVWDLAFSVDTRQWGKAAPVPLLPPRFCAAVAPLVTAQMRHELQEDVDGSGTGFRGAPSIICIGGMSDHYKLTNTVARFDFDTMRRSVLECVGAAPPEQFKGACVYEEFGNSVWLVDGFYSIEEGASQRSQAHRRLKMMRHLQLDTGVWREVNAAPPLVRSQVLPRWSEDGGRLRLCALYIVGGMEMFGQRRRVNDVHKYNMDLQMWEGDEGRGAPLAGFVGASAHTACSIPDPRPPACRELLRREARLSRSERHGHVISAVVFGGNIDEGPDDANSYGVPVGSLQLLGFREMRLIDCCALAIHMLRVPYAINCLADDQKDSLLEELF